MPGPLPPLVSFALLCALVAPPLAGCRAAPPPEETAYRSLMAKMANLQDEQKRFAKDHTLPQQLDFPGHGAVTIRQLSLDGYPGNSYVRCRFHYQNDTGRPVLRAVITLDVLDAAGQTVASESTVCIFPTPRAIHDGTFFSSELRTQTLDVHEQPGWRWRLSCSAEFMDEDDG